MPSTLELCEKYYGTRDIYALLGITKDTLEKDIKKAYYKLSLQVHPDRVADGEKEIATEKFKVLTKLHTILTDKEKRALYDEQGTIDDDGDSDVSWLEKWRQFFKPITKNDIDNFKNEYIGSDTEKRDIQKAYLNGSGCINYMMNSVPFMAVEDEPRIIGIVKEWIADGVVPEYKIFTEEPKAKRNRRHKKYAREALEAREIRKQMEANAEENDLAKQIMKRGADRAAASNNFYDHLMSKYGGDDDSEDFVIPPKRKGRKVSKPASKNGKTGDRTVKNGRVSKKKK